jgi:hypothetical protein
MMHWTDAQLDVLLAEAADLLHQATTERSHFYVATVLSKCMAAITSLQVEREKRG